MLKLKIHVMFLMCFIAFQDVNAITLEEIESEVAQSHGWQNALIVLSDKRNRCNDEVMSYRYDEAHKTKIILQCGIKEVTFSFYEAVLLPVAKHNIRAGNVILSEDLAMHKFMKRNNLNEAIQDVEPLISMMAKTNIAPKKPIFAKQLSEPVVIAKGKAVTIVYAKNNVLIEVPGVAQQNGTQNQVIKIKQQNNNILFAKVINQDTVLMQE
jgi:flagella basal body P-ring formation protein FlgA